MTHMAIGQTWSNIYGDESMGTINGYGLVTTENDNLIVQEIQTLQDRQVIRLRKLSAVDGSEMASYSYGDLGEFVLPGASKSIAKSEEGYLLVFAVEMEDSLKSVAVQLDYDLEEIWSLELTRVTESYWLHGIPTSASSFLAVGYTSESSNGDDAILLEHWNSDGQLLWQKIHESDDSPFEDYQIRANAISRVNSNLFALSCRKTDYSTFDDCSYLSYDRDRMVFLVDSIGDLIMDYDGDENCDFDYYPSLVLAMGNDLLIGGGDLNELENCGQSYDCYNTSITKLDDSLDEVWRNSYGVPSILATFKALDINSESQIIASGEHWSMEGGRTQGVICEVDVDGELNWLYNYRYQLDRPSGWNDIVVMADGRIAVVGYSEQSVSNSTRNSWVAVLDEEGCLTPDCVSLSPQLNLPEGEIVLSPNPCEGRFKIAGLNGNFELLTVLSVDGHVVMNSQITKGSDIKNVDISSLPSGFYFIHLMGDIGTYTSTIVSL